MDNIVILPRKTTFWTLRSEEAIQAAREADILSGNSMTSDGESKIYSSVVPSWSNTDLVVTITRRRGIEWPTWSRRPKGLVEGLTTIDGVPRQILLTVRR